MATAGITTNLKKLMLNLLESDIDSDTYYVGLARSNETIDFSGTESSTLAEQRGLRNQLHSVKVLSKTNLVVPTIEWQGNNTYTPYDDDNDDLTNFYVVNSKREIFVCIEVSKNVDGTTNPSTVEPTSNLAGTQQKSFRTVDGYLWRFLHAVNNGVYSDFKNISYMPVSKIDLLNPTLLEDITSTTLQDSSVAGEILSIAIDSGGQGYTTIPGITIQGNGISAAFVATLSNGVITRIQVDSDDANVYTHGSGFDFAKVTPSYGDAVLRPVIGPSAGFSSDPRDTLQARHVSLKVDFDNTETGTILAENDFQTVAIMKNVNTPAGAAFSGNTGNALNSFTLSSVQGGSTFNEDEFINTSSGVASGKVFHWDGANTLYYYQNDSTGYGTFTSGLGITTPSGGAATINAINLPDIDRYSGEILYINNFVEVARDANQTEDIRLVLELD